VPPEPPDPLDGSGGEGGLAGIWVAGGNVGGGKVAGGKVASPVADAAGLAGTAGKVPSAAPSGLAGSAVQFDVADGELAGPAPASADSDGSSDLGGAEVAPPGRSAAREDATAPVAAELAVAGLAAARLPEAGLAAAGLPEAGLAEAGSGGVRSAHLVNVGHGPLSGSGDCAGGVAFPVLRSADGLLAVTAAAEPGMAEGAVGAPGAVAAPVRLAPPVPLPLRVQLAPQVRLAPPVLPALLAAGIRMG